MSGVDLQAITEKVAAQIKAGIAKQSNVDAGPSSTTGPRISVNSNPSTYINYWSTYGGNGYLDLYLMIKIEVTAADPLSACILMWRYLAVGTGNNSSIVDALRAEPTLGGLVDDLKPEEAEWDSETDPYTGRIPLRLMVKKVGAQP